MAHPPSIIIAPSILAADLGRLQAEVESIQDEADWLHIDVMDGHFVPNLSFGAPVVRCIHTRLPLDVHLMVSNPAERVEEFTAISVAHISFHAEAVATTSERTELIRTIKTGGATAGIALRPHTPLHAIQDVVDEVDLVLIMSVEPGFGGQAFMPDVLEKVRTLRASHPLLAIQIDGGINEQTAALCRSAGATHLVAGSYIFKAPNRAAAIRSLRGSV